MYCIDCGSSIGDQVRFCSGCGFDNSLSNKKINFKNWLIISVVLLIGFLLIYIFVLSPTKKTSAETISIPLQKIDPPQVKNKEEKIKPLVNPPNKLDSAMNKWVEENDFGRWAQCSSISIDIRAVTLDTASDSLLTKLKVMDASMRIARSKFIAKGISNAVLDKVQQAAFNQNRFQSPQLKGEIFNECLDSLDRTARAVQ